MGDGTVFTFRKDLPMVDAKGIPQRHFTIAFDQVSGQASTAATGGVTHTSGTLTLNEPVVGNSGGDIKTIPVLLPSQGGTGSTTTPTNGQIPIGNGTTYVAATLTAGAGISVTNGAGTVAIASTYAPIMVTTVVIAHAAIVTLPTTAVTVMAAPGAGRQIIPLHARLIANTSAGAYTNINAGATTGTGAEIELIVGTGQDQFSYLVNGWGASAGGDTGQSLVSQFLGVSGSQQWEPRRFGAGKDPTDGTTDPFFLLGWGLLQDATINAPSTVLNEPMVLSMTNSAGNLTGGDPANSLTVTIVSLSI